MNLIQKRRLYMGLSSLIIIVLHGWKRWVLASPDGRLETQSQAVALESEVYCDMLIGQMGFALLTETISSPGCALESGDL